MTLWRRWSSNALLKVVFKDAANVYQIIAVLVTDILDRLGNNWACIKIVSDIMAGGSDEFDTAFPGLMIGFWPDEAGKKEW